MVAVYLCRAHGEFGAHVSGHSYGPARKRCPRCRILCRWDRNIIGGLIRNTKPRIPSHFNRSLGCQVHSREHLEHLQKKLGVSDYSPGPGATPPTWWE